MIKEAQKQDRRWIVWMSLVVVAVVAAVAVSIWIQHEQIMSLADNSFSKTTSSDIAGHQRFADAYTKLTADNVFVYRNSQEILDILDKGSGVIFFCDPSSAWCQYYAPYLDKAAKNKRVEKVFYYNIAGGSKDEDIYHQIAKKVNTFLPDFQKDTISVPLVVFVNKGTIVAVDLETADGNVPAENPDDYWTVEALDDLVKRLGDDITLLK